MAALTYIHAGGLDLSTYAPDVFGKATLPAPKKSTIKKYVGVHASKRCYLRLVKCSGMIIRIT